MPAKPALHPCSPAVRVSSRAYRQPPRSAFLVVSPRLLPCPCRTSRLVSTLHFQFRDGGIGKGRPVANGGGGGDRHRPRRCLFFNAESSHRTFGAMRWRSTWHGTEGRRDALAQRAYLGKRCCRTRPRWHNQQMVSYQGHHRLLFLRMLAVASGRAGGHADAGGMGGRCIWDGDATARSG